MAALLTVLSTSKYLVPQERLLAMTPALVDPVLAVNYGMASVFVPLGLRFAVAARVAKGGVDNVNPRGQIATLVPENEAFARLHASYQNGLETYPHFAGAILAGIVAGVDEERLSKIATLWLFLRQMFWMMYLYQNKTTSSIRSILWVWSTSLCANLVQEAAKKMASKRVLK